MSVKGIEKFKGDLNKSQEQFDVVLKELLKVSLEKKKLQRDKYEADSIIRCRIQSEEKSAEEIEELKRDLMKSQEQFEVVQKELLKVSLEKKELQSDTNKIEFEEKLAKEIEKLKDDLKKSQEQFEVLQKELQKVSLEKTESEEKSVKGIEKLKEDLNKSQEQFDVVNHKSLKVSLENKNLEDDKGKAETFKSHGFKSEVEDMEKIKFDLKESEKQLKMVEKKLLKVFLEKEKLQDDKVKAETILKSRIHNEEKSAEEIEKLKDDLKKSQDQFEVVQKELQEVSLEKKELQSDKDEADSIIRSRIQSEEKSAEEIEKLKRDLMKSQEQFEVVQKELLKVSLEKKELQSDKNKTEFEEKLAKEIEKLKDDLKKSQEQFEVLQKELQKVSLEKTESEAKSVKGIEKLKEDLNKSQDQFDVVNHKSLKVSLENKNLEDDKGKAETFKSHGFKSEVEDMEKIKFDLKESEKQLKMVEKKLLKVFLEKEKLQDDKVKAETILKSRIQSEEKSAEEIEKLKDDLKKSQEQFEVLKEQLQKVSLEKKELQSDKDEADSIIRSRIQSEEKSAEEIEKLKRDLMKSQEQFEVVQKELLKVILEKKELQSDKAEGDSIIRSRIQSEENSAEEIETLKADLRKSQEQFKEVKEQLQKVSLGNVKMSVQCEKGKTEEFGASSGAALPNELKQLSLTKITKQLPNLQKELVKTRKQLESMSQQLTDLSGENQKLRLIKVDDIRESTEAVNELLEKMNVTQKEFEKVRQELLQSNEENSRWLLSMKETSNASCQEVGADFQIELTKAKQQRNTMEKRLFEQRIENKKLKKQLRRFKVNERKTIEQSRSRKNINIWKKRAEIAREETQQSFAYTDKLKEIHDKEIANLQRTMDALLTQRDELHKDKDVLNGEKMAMEKKQKDLQERILQLNEQLKKKSKQLNDSQQSNVSLSEMMESLQLDQSVRDQNEVKAKVDRIIIQHSLQSMTAALQVANTKLKKSQCDIQCMEEKTAELNLEIGGLNLNISQAKVRETALKESLEKTNQKVCELKEKIKYARAQCEECEHSKSLIKMLNADLNKLQSSYDKQHFSINTMSTRMQQLQNDCQTLQDQNQGLQQYIDSANEREKILYKSLATINKAFELERANNSALKIELETNQITLEHVRNQSTKRYGDLQARYDALKLATDADEREHVEKVARLGDKLRKKDMSNDLYLKELNYWKSQAEDLKNEIERQKQMLSQANKFRVAKME
ncbi:putative leucine-rich repeat-containing protein DDB_G0290503 isoform X2 [Drosophila sulfurigaster albostrigata]|uniref:putative leucine-rich repeat-containing protein DDB_G0290503 isoform X2 n=1 Tax=Drosophila sulfurigaster albostrigata TaxID=89887 RepID=UPI002D219FE8|nr:putative leucine-rich repeat-containing protein DDB_G0290503 isoform X2 [Drosophila sulfurigaster albostrigata]